MANIDPNSIVDYLKSVGQDTSLGNRTKLGTQYGIDFTKTTDNYATQNTALLTALKGAKTPVGTGSPADVTDPAGAHSFINGGQQNDFNSASSTTKDEPPVKSSTQAYTDMFNNLKSTLAPTTTQPATPNFTEQYKGLLQTNGITDLETSLNDLKKSARAITDANQALAFDEQGKPVAMNVIEGRMSEEQKQAQVKLDAINRQIEDTSNQLTTKYNVVNNLMNFGKLDYQNAVDTYDKQFTQNLNLFNTVKGITESDKSNADKIADNARANLQIIYNNISSGGSDLSSITADEKANITKLETQAGLPVGFYQSLQVKNPKANILSTTTRDSNGTKYADVIMSNPDGSLSIKSITLGSSSSGSDSSQAEQLKVAVSTVAPQLQARRGGDGYVSPEDYQKARDAWVNNGNSTDTFDKNFKQYANPESYSKLGISF